VRIQVFHPVRIELDAGADAREGGRLLVDVGLDAGLAQRRRRGQAGNPGADDRYRRLALRHRSADIRATCCTKRKLRNIAR